MVKTIDINTEMQTIAGKHCLPVNIVKVNDQVLRLSYIDGEFHWHKHKNEDELFYILKGKLVIQLKNKPDITLREGQMAVIPKGVEHCPKSNSPTYVLLFEPFNLQTKGD